MSVLVTEEISKNFSGLQALSKVSLELPRGKILGLIGPNGSGKTTLLNIITGVLHPDHGRISIDNVNITGWETDKIARLGIVRTFQVARTFSDLSVRENVEVAVMKRPGETQQIDMQVEHFLERLDLSEWSTTRASSLPYGVQRRLEIARALGARPRFLLLDEPAAGLNEEEVDELLSMIRGIRDDAEFECGILLIDHDLRMIMRCCDTIQVLNEGRTIAKGTPEEVRHEPAVIESYIGKEDEN